MDTDPFIKGKRGESQAFGADVVLSDEAVMFENQQLTVPTPDFLTLSNLRQVSNKFLQFNRNGNYAYRRSEQIRAGDGARLRGGLPALRIRTGRVATSSEGKDSGSGVRYSFRQQCRNGRPLRF
jgi:hypothetical protein